MSLLLKNYKKIMNSKIKSKEKSDKKSDNKFKVGILGATGMVGQRLITLLYKHPWFEIVCLGASDRSQGKSYKEAVESRWSQAISIPKNISEKKVLSVEKDMQEIANQVDFVFCAIDGDKYFIQKLEESYASLGVPVISNNSAHRWTTDVPMIMTEINPEHLDIIKIQKKNRGFTDGFIVVKPNCSLQSYVPLLYAWKNFLPEKVIVSTYQAISGAGKTFESWPEMVDNVIPYIGGEEEKSETEPGKIFGKIKNGKIAPSNLPKISASCVRVAVADGHLATINVKFKKKVTKDQLIKALKNFKNPLEKLGLPSSPKIFITYFEEDNRPQTKIDRDLYSGMGISAGRIREDFILGWKCVALSHNTIRGAAGGSVLTAELLVKKGYIKKKR